MDIFVTDNVSEKFYRAVKDAHDTFPDYIQKMDTRIILGHTLFDINPSLRHRKNHYWGDVAMMYRFRTDEILLGEHARSLTSGKLVKNQTILGGIAHEIGHAFDRTIFNDPEEQLCFSNDEEQPFIHAWRHDVKELKHDPDQYKPLGEIFERHMVEGGYGARETFAEIWANAHGQSGLWDHGIDDIRLFWPACTAVIEECIAHL
ncbi:MAG: hypothetical protein ACLFR0_02465 [Alphaproteobacteria bacterium]